MNIELIKGAINGDLFRIKNALEHGANIHVDYDTMLFEAINNKHLHIVKYLIKNSSYIDEFIHKMYKFIVMSLQTENYDIAQLIIDAIRNDSNFQYIVGKALDITVRTGKIQDVIFLIDNNTDFSYSNYLPLRSAIFFNHIHIVEYLIKKGSKINSEGGEPLRIAIKIGNLDIIKLLVENGANILYDYSWTIGTLETAVSNRKLDIVKYLVEKGADIHIKNNLPLSLAIENRDFQIVKFLLENGANVNETQKTRIPNILHAIYKGSKEIVELLIKYGADISVMNNKPLKNAIINENMDMIILLLENGAKYDDITIELAPTQKIKDLLLNFEGSILTKYACKT